MDLFDKICCYVGYALLVLLLLALLGWVAYCKYRQVDFFLNP